MVEYFIEYSPLPEAKQRPVVVGVVLFVQGRVLFALLKNKGKNHTNLSLKPIFFILLPSWEFPGVLNVAPTTYYINDVQKVAWIVEALPWDS